MNQQGNISFVFVFLLIAITVIFMFVFLAPALQNYTTRVFVIAEPLIDDANTIAGTIDDAPIRTSIQNTLQDSKDTTATQIEVLGFFYQFAWFFVIALSAFILIIYSRFLVERQVGGAA